MEFKTCIHCNECKTTRQFSLRYREVCRSCVPDFIREHGRKAEEHAVEFKDMITERPIEHILPKETPPRSKRPSVVDTGKMISKPKQVVAENRGYKVLSVPKPKVSSLSA